MPGVSLQNTARTDQQAALRDLQRQAETLFLAKKALEFDLARQRNTQPGLFMPPPEPMVPLRLLGKWVPLLGRWQARRCLRRCGLFEAAWYLARYPDVALAKADPLHHYLASGAGEERDPGPRFCTAQYLRLYPDVARDGMNPLLHYIRKGWAEKRQIYPAPARPVAAKRPSTGTTLITGTTLAVPKAMS